MTYENYLLPQKSYNWNEENDTFFYRPPPPPHKIKSWHVSSAKYVWLFLFFFFFVSIKYLYSTPENYNGKRFARSHKIIVPYKIIFACTRIHRYYIMIVTIIAFPASGFQSISRSDKPNKQYYIIFSNLHVLLLTARWYYNNITSAIYWHGKVNNRFFTVGKHRPVY